MNLIKGQLRPKVDYSSDKIIQEFKEGFSNLRIIGNVSALLFYGSRLFGNNNSDYDMDLLLHTFQEDDYEIIGKVLDAAKSVTGANIDFEVYYEDLIEIGDNFTTGGQGCYFLYTWAYADPIIGSNDRFKEAVGKLSPAALKCDLDRKINNYFCRTRHALINGDELRINSIKKTLARAISDCDMIIGKIGLESIVGYSPNELLSRELYSPTLCTADMLGLVENLILGTSTKEELYDLTNKLNLRYHQVIKSQ